jgi:tetratricopeptide (TPR) repeat protein
MEELGREHIVSLKVLGFLYLRLGFFDRATRLFRALSALLPEDAEAALSLAAALLENGDAAEALSLLDAPSLADDPAGLAASGNRAGPAFLLLKARALWRLQKNEEALAVMDRYLAAGEAR